MQQIKKFMTSIPNKQKAVFLEKFGTNPIVKEIEMPQLKDQELLVKVEAAPIHPSDQGFIKGYYDIEKKAPCVPGFEGSGTIVDAKGDLEKTFIGKRVGFQATSNLFGSYGQYSVSSVKNIVVLPEGISFEQGCSAITNPFTVALMFDNAKKANQKAVVHTVGASQVGRQMTRYFQRNGIEVLNIVRRQEQVEILKKMGARYVLNQSDSDFWEQFKQLSEKLEAKYAFDAVAGEMTSKLVDNMPSGSHIFVYGDLSKDMLPKINVQQLLFNDKHLSGFWMFPEIAKRSPQEMIEIGNTVAEHLGDDFATDVYKTYSFEQFNQASAEYSKNMTNGKVVIKSEL